MQKESYSSLLTIPLTAWLGRVFGVRLYLLVNVSLFLVFSGLCGTASELTQMIFYRALQGFTGGAIPGCWPSGPAHPDKVR